jgi:hypothetical protein
VTGETTAETDWAEGKTAAAGETAADSTSPEETGGDPTGASLVETEGTNFAATAPVPGPAPQEPTGSTGAEDETACRTEVSREIRANPESGFFGTAPGLGGGRPETSSATTRPASGVVGPLAGETAWAGPDTSHDTSHQPTTAPATTSRRRATIAALPGGATVRAQVTVGEPPDAGPKWDVPSNAARHAPPGASTRPA